MTPPLILYVKRNCLDDGPGIRTTVFFKGCPLSCAWCHNPESQSVAPELSYDRERCLGCGACIMACPREAIDPESADYINRTRCDYCFACVEVCPSGALSAMGRRMSVDEIVAIIEKDLPFFRQSKGGVTLSGGEPTMFVEFAAALARACRERGVHTLLETCGQFEFKLFREQLFPQLDSIYFDVKLIDSKQHREHCGVGNERIIDNLRALAKLANDGGATVLPRIPLAPGVTDTDENLRGLASLLHELGFRAVALLPYNPTWHKKSKMLGRAPRFAATNWLSAERLAQCRSFFHEFEIF
jgi:pyruvate formate lyase activating enzyme